MGAHPKNPPPPPPPLQISTGICLLYYYHVRNFRITCSCKYHSIKRWWQENTESWPELGIYYHSIKAGKSSTSHTWDPCSNPGGGLTRVASMHEWEGKRCESHFAPVSVTDWCIMIFIKKIFFKKGAGIIYKAYIQVLPRKQFTLFTCVYISYVFCKQQIYIYLV